MLKPVKNTLSPAARAWGSTLAVLGGSLAAYVATALLVATLLGDPIAGAAASNLVLLVLAITYRWRSTGTPLASSPAPRALRPSFWITAAAGLAACWLAGQAAASWVYSTWGSPAFDAANAAKSGSPLWLLVLTTLFLAPIGEESLMRGIAFPALRRHWSPLAAAFVTSMVFALLHGNLVQIALTVPLGILLAFVYEASQRLWPVILMHVIFNMLSSFVPSELVASVTHPPMIIVMLIIVAVLIFALTPGRYPAERDEHGQGANRTTA